MIEPAPYGIVNFDALWWVVILVTVIIIAAFYLISVSLTRPLAGNSDEILYRKSPIVRRMATFSMLQGLEKKLSAGEISAEEVSKSVHDILIQFLQTKTRRDITGYTYAELAQSGAPDDLLETISQSYHILYTRSADSEKQYRATELLSTSKKVVMKWR